MTRFKPHHTHDHHNTAPSRVAIQQGADEIQHTWSERERYRRRLLASLRLLRLQLALS